MKKLCSTWVLTLVILLCLAPATLLADGGNGGGGNGGGNNCGGGGKGRHDDCHQVPEGGSGIIYLLAAGATCAGAIVIRSRQTKRNPA